LEWKEHARKKKEDSRLSFTDGELGASRLRKRLSSGIRQHQHFFQLNRFDSGSIPAFKRIGITGVGWHTFRHSVGTMLAEMGEHQLTIRDYLRHSNFTSRTNTCRRHRRPSGWHRQIGRCHFADGYFAEDKPNSMIAACERVRMGTFSSGAYRPP
jgi:integrase